MRMWMIEPSLLCRSHLLGEHFEIHKAVGNLKHGGKWAQSLTNKGYLEPQHFKSRHEELVREMLIRGYGHNSPLDVSNIFLPVGHVDANRSYRDLIVRCGDCEENILKVIM